MKVAGVVYNVTSYNYSGCEKNTAWVVVVDTAWVVAASVIKILSHPRKTNCPILVAPIVLSS